MSYDNVYTALKMFPFFNHRQMHLGPSPHERGCSTPFRAAAEPFISSAALEDPKLQRGPYELHELLGKEKTRVTRIANAPYVLLLVNSCLLIAINYQVIPAK